jgi:hypothetical protein
MKNSSVQPDSRSLVEQALHHIQLLSDILDQLVDKSDSGNSLNSQKEQLADLTKMINQWEAKNLPVPDEFRMMQMKLTAEVDHAKEKASILDRIKQGLQDALSKIPYEKQIVNQGVKISKQYAGSSNVPRTDREIYRDLIAAILRDLGGSASTQVLKEEIKKKLAGRFTEADLGYTTAGERRWWKNARYTKTDLVKKGLLRNNSPKGVWELSEEIFESSPKVD